MIPSFPPTPLWRLEVPVPEHAVAGFEVAFEGVCAAVTSFGDETTPWRIEGYTDVDPDQTAIEGGLAMAAQATGIELPSLTIEFLSPRDWLADNLAAFEPLRIGRFFIYPSHFEEAPPPASIAFKIDAGTAFGSGTHPTTGTCLQALADVAKSQRVGRALDLGCGSGILAFAIAKLWPAKVLAVDIDPEAVRVTKQNTIDNKLLGRVNVATSVGYRSNVVRSTAPFDLIVANVLARPLIGMAADTSASLAPGGTVILSGLLERDAAWVVSRHRAYGLVFVRQWCLNDWATLVMRKPGVHD